MGFGTSPKTDWMRIASVSVAGLRGKHYGTNIKLSIVSETGTSQTAFNIWLPLGRPSDKQMESWGYTREDWDNNIRIPDGWNDEAWVAIQEAYTDYDNHYQSAFEVAVVERIVDALEGWEWDGHPNKEEF